MKEYNFDDKNFKKYTYNSFKKIINHCKKVSKGFTNCRFYMIPYIHIGTNRLSLIIIGYYYIGFKEPSIKSISYNIPFNKKDLYDFKLEDLNDTLRWRLFNISDFNLNGLDLLADLIKSKDSRKLILYEKSNRENCIVDANFNKQIIGKKNPTNKPVILTKIALSSLFNDLEYKYLERDKSLQISDFIVNKMKLQFKENDKSDEGLFEVNNMKFYKQLFPSTFPNEIYSDMLEIKTFYNNTISENRIIMLMKYSDMSIFLRWHCLHEINNQKEIKV